MKYQLNYIVFVSAISACLGTTIANSDTIVDLDKQLNEARRAYDAEASRSVFGRATDYAEASPGEDSYWLVARAALAAAELQRIVFESSEFSSSERREMGGLIDDIAEAGHAALDELSESSEAHRIRADLYGTMIRTKFQGKKYAKKMDAASEKALELDPQNPHAHVTATKRLLFASERRGGDIDKALEHLNAALKIDPSHEMALILRGTAYKKQGDLSASKADWTRAIELNPHCKAAIDNLEKFEE
jgi:tetratricopeptide (TPR) repeat protein